MPLFSLIAYSVAFVVVFFAAFYIYLCARRVWANRELELQRMRALVAIVSALNGSMSPVRDKMKRATRLLSDLGASQGWRCRIVLHSDPATLPPSGEGLGFHLPIAIDTHSVGTLIVSRGPDQFSDDEAVFFETLRRCLAAFIYRERLWDDFHSHLERVQASLLLGIDTTPEQAVGRVNEMLSVLKEP
jgi:hypothetical protein